MAWTFAEIYQGNNVDYQENQGMILNMSRKPSGAIHASGKESTPLEALRANAAHTQSMLSASVAVLELAGGGGTFDAVGNLKLRRTMGRQVALSAEGNF